jgi:threonine dehydratase
MAGCWAETEPAAALDGIQAKGILEMASVTMRDIFSARRRIQPLIARTTLVHSPALSQSTGASVHLKLECHQETGSFKIRGAANRMLCLSDAEKARGVVTVSTGNHGRAVAHVAGQLGIKAVVCLSVQVPANKVDALRRLGAEVVVAGSGYDEAMLHAYRMQETRGLTWIEPFDDPLVIAGQGTAGLEILEDLPEIDTAIIPLSGGGLLSGIGLALKSADPSIRVVGVSMERGPAMVLSLRAGRVVEVVEEPTLADALGGGLGVSNTFTFDLVRRLADETVLVSEDEIAEAMAFALREQHLVVEGGGAVGIAALLSGKIERPGRRTAVVVSGGNVDTQRLLEIARDRSA